MKTIFNINIEGYSLNVIEFFRDRLENENESVRADAYRRLCKVTLKEPKLKPTKHDFQLLYVNTNNLITALRLRLKSN